MVERFLNNKCNFSNRFTFIVINKKINFGNIKNFSKNIRGYVDIYKRLIYEKYKQEITRFSTGYTVENVENSMFSTEKLFIFNFFS